MSTRSYLILSAVAVGAAALLPPMHDLAHDSFAWHMLQHLILIFIVSPLLVYGLPGNGRLSSMAAMGPLGAVILHAVALWAWHLPLLYDTALEQPALHALEHLSFVGTGVLFWGVIAARWRPVDPLRRAGAVFVTGLQSAALGALLTFASEPLYRSHLHTTQDLGLTPLEDQQLAGGIMWVPPGVVYLVVTLALLRAWLNHTTTDEIPGAPDGRPAP
jgi:cytochrome c oxidase assembly factor CtaG